MSECRRTATKDGGPCTVGLQPREAEALLRGQVRPKSVTCVVEDPYS